MGTKASISVRFEDGSYYKTMVNWDGYLSHVGKILRDFYSDPNKAFDLIDGGEIRSFNIIDNYDIEVSYYEDDDYYPINTTDYVDGEFSYLWDNIVGCWYVSFFDHDENKEVVMKLDDAITKYGDRY